MNQIVNNLKQVKQNLNNINSRINQHVNDMQQLSQMFGQSFQALDNCERIAQTQSTGTQSNFTGSNYQGGFGTSQYTGNNTGYQKQFYTSQRHSGAPASHSLNTMDNDITPAYYNMKQNNPNNLSGMNTANQQYTGRSANQNFNSGSQYSGMNNTLNNVNQKFSDLNNYSTANEMYTGTSANSQNLNNNRNY